MLGQDLEDQLKREKRDYMNKEGTARDQESLHSFWSIEHLNVPL